MNRPAQLVPQGQELAHIGQKKNPDVKEPMWYHVVCDSMTQIKNTFDKKELLLCLLRLAGITYCHVVIRHFTNRFISETMLRQHFTSVYPQIPVFDYVDFVDSYLSGSFSWFMMQAVLASAVPYTAMEVLTECGFTDRLTALQFFFSNAVRLYDFEYEESQLAKLQGSLVLSTVLVSYTMDKDFRFWHHNAVRLAVRLGLHKE